MCYVNFARSLVWKNLREETGRRKDVWICLILKKIPVLDDSDV